LSVRRRLDVTIHCSNVDDEFDGENFLDFLPFIYISLNAENIWHLYALLLAPDFGINCYNPVKYSNLIFIVI